MRLRHKRSVIVEPQSWSGVWESWVITTVGAAIPPIIVVTQNQLSIYFLSILKFLCPSHEIQSCENVYVWTRIFSLSWAYNAPCHIAFCCVWMMKTIPLTGLGQLWMIGFLLWFTMQRDTMVWGVLANNLQIKLISNALHMHGQSISESVYGHNIMMSCISRTKCCPQITVYAVTSSILCAQL